jgi:hypothetical protein
MIPPLDIGGGLLADPSEVWKSRFRVREREKGRMGEREKGRKGNGRRADYKPPLPPGVLTW